MGEFEDRERISAAPTSKAKSKAPLPKQAPASTASSTIHAAGSSALLNAQHWFDKGAAAAGSKRPLDWRTVCANGYQSLKQARSVLAGLDTLSRPLIARVDELRNAMDLYFIKMTPLVSASEAALYQKVVASIHDEDLTLRFAFDLPFEPPKSTHRFEGNAGAAHSAQALNATLDLITFDTRSTLASVRAKLDPAFYRPLLLTKLRSLDANLTYAKSLMDGYEGNDQQRAFASKVHGATLELANLQRFISDRQNNRDLIGEFEAIATKADALRGSVKLGRMEDIELASTNRQVNAKDAESAEIDEAEKAFGQGLDALKEQIQLGANRFFQFAQFENPPEPGSMWGELAAGLLISLLGNLVGPAIGKFIGMGAKPTVNVIAPEPKGPFGKVIGEEVRDVIGDGVQDGVVGTSTDVTQAWASTIKDAETKAGSKDERVRDAVFFHETLLEGRFTLEARAKEHVRLRRKDKSISAAAISALATEARREAATAKERTYQGAARDFALFLARRGLGGVDQVKNPKTGEIKTTTKIGTSHDYFHGGDLHHAGKRDGVEGIGRVTVELDEAGHSITGFALAGLNVEMANAVLNGANRRLDRLGIPTEIHLVPKWSRQRPIFVIDEHGSVRASGHWRDYEASDPAVRGVFDRFATPDKAWASLRGEIIPDNAKVR